MAGKTFIILGVILVLVGLLIQLLPGNGLPRLPGDILVKRENMTFYFPLGWCVVISVVLTLLVRLFGKQG